ncbi:MAG: GNAT family N-acetyltransferase [Anaerolineae bacterium]|nr:GNAT family N-acetyltransferase [Anaerolineae bacterium]
MPHVSSWIQSLWIDAQVNAPPALQRRVIPRLHEAKEILRLVAKPYLVVRCLQGQGQGGALTAACAGSDYTMSFLQSLLFVQPPVEQSVERIPLWRCHERVEALSSDIIVIEAARHLIHRLPRERAIVLPQYVHHILDVRGEWEDVQRRLPKNARREFKVLRKHDYQYETSYEDQDFEAFYHDMYLPTMENQHGDLSSPMSAGEAYQYFKHGLLFFVRRDGQRVCASVFHFQQDVIRFMIMGVLGGDRQIIKEGAVSALNCLRLQWANEKGYREVNFLGSDPYLENGLFQYKRKWGTTVSVPPILHRQIWIKVQRLTPAVSRFLTDNPCIVIDRDASLRGLVVVQDAQTVSDEVKTRWSKRYATPGLSDLVVRPLHWFTQAPANADVLDVIIPAPLDLDPEGE